MIGRKHDRTGRSGGTLANRRFREANCPPPGEAWVWLTQSMLESPAFRVMSGGARMILDRVMIEHMAHGGTRNGALKVTYKDFVRYGLRKSSILPFLAEAIALGFLERTATGTRAWGGFKGSPGQFRLTWLPTYDGQPASNAWKNHTDVQTTQDAVTRARDDVEKERARAKSVRRRVGHVRVMAAE